MSMENFVRDVKEILNLHGPTPDILGTLRSLVAATGEGAQRYEAKLLNFAEDERILFCGSCLLEAMNHNLVIFSCGLPAASPVPVAEGEPEQCGEFKPSARGVPEPQDRCVLAAGHEGRHTLTPHALTAAPVVEASQDCLGCIASSAGLGRCRVHEPKPTTVTPSEAAREQLRGIIDRVLGNDEYGQLLSQSILSRLVNEIAALFPSTEATQDWCDHCSADLNGMKHILCERCYREFDESIYTRESLRAAILNWLAHRCGRAPVCGNCTYCRAATFVQSVEVTEAAQPAVEAAMCAEIALWVERRSIENVAQTEINALAKRLAAVVPVDAEEVERLRFDIHSLRLYNEDGSYTPVAQNIAACARANAIGEAIEAVRHIANGPVSLIASSGWGDGVRAALIALESLMQKQETQ